MLSQTSVRPKSFCKIWLRKCVHNTLMLVLVGVGLQEQLADIAATQVRDARLVPGYSAEVRRALGILPRSAPTRLLCFAHKAAHWFCPHRPPIHKLAAWSSSPTRRDKIPSLVNPILIEGTQRYLLYGMYRKRCYYTLKVS